LPGELEGHPGVEESSSPEFCFLEVSEPSGAPRLLSKPNRQLGFSQAAGCTSHPGELYNRDSYLWPFALGVSLRNGHRQMTKGHSPSEAQKPQLTGPVRGWGPCLPEPEAVSVFLPTFLCVCVCVCVCIQTGVLKTYRLGFKSRFCLLGGMGNLFL
jgi:hypothetical protein